MEELKDRDLKARQEEEEDEAVDGEVSSLVEDSRPARHIVIAGILLFVLRERARGKKTRD